MNRFTQGVKKRREERLRLLKKKQKSIHPHIHSRPQGNEFIRISPIYLKIFASLLIFMFVFWMMDSDRAEFDQVQSVIYEVMHQDIQTEQVVSWYRERVGDMPAFLPEIIERQPVFSPQTEAAYYLPVSTAQIKETFEENGQTITLNTTQPTAVYAVKEGWVTYVARENQLGLTVKIDHGQGEESWYGNLEHVDIQLHDWVEEAKVIGTTDVDQNQRQGMLYFGIKRDDMFIDPLAVMSFD